MASSARADRVGERTLTLQWRPSRMSACPPPLTSPPDGRGCHGTDRCVPPWHTLSYRPVPAGRRGLEVVGVCARAPCVRARSCMRILEAAGEGRALKYTQAPVSAETSMAPSGAYSASEMPPTPTAAECDAVCNMHHATPLDPTPMRIRPTHIYIYDPHI